MKNNASSKDVFEMSNKIVCVICYFLAKIMSKKITDFTNLTLKKIISNSLFHKLYEWKLLYMYLKLLHYFCPLLKALILLIDSFYCFIHTQMTVFFMI